MAGYGVKTKGEFPLLQHPYSDHLKNQTVRYINRDGVHHLSTAYDLLLKILIDNEQVAEMPSSLEFRVSKLGIKRED